MQAVNSASVRHWRIVYARLPDDSDDDGGDEVEESMCKYRVQIQVLFTGGKNDESLKAELC